MVICIESLRFEHLVVIAGDDVGDIVVVGPGDCGSSRDRDGCRAKAEVVDLDCSGACGLSPGLVAEFALVPVVKAKAVTTSAVNPNINLILFICFSFESF